MCLTQLLTAASDLYSMFSSFKILTNISDLLYAKMNTKIFFCKLLIHQISILDEKV